MQTLSLQLLKIDKKLKKGQAACDKASAAYKAKSQLLEDDLRKKHSLNVALSGLKLKLMRLMREYGDTSDNPTLVLTSPENLGRIS